MQNNKELLRASNKSTNSHEDNTDTKVPKAPKAPKALRYGIIGMGNQGTHYTKMFMDGKIENGELTALCDTDSAKIDRARTLTADKDIKFFTNYIEMLESGFVDAIIVAVPHYAHPEMVIESLKHNIHAICDKPAGVYTKQVREMNEFAKTATAKFTMMFNQRTNCVYRKMREIIASGELGSLQRVTWIITNWYRTQHYYDTGAWRATWDGEGGGVLINQCPHQIDLIQWVLGEMPTKVTGFCHYGKWHNIEVEDDVTAYFEYKNGASGVFITATGEAPGTNRFEVSGTKGKLVCEHDKLSWYKNDADSLEHSKTATSGFTTPKVSEQTIETDGKNPQHAGIINNFTNHILGLEELFVSGEEGINGVELMNAIELSGWQKNKQITLPVNEKLYLKLLNKKRKTSKTKENVVAKIENTSGTFGGK